MKGTIIGDIVGSPYEFRKIRIKDKNFAWFAPKSRFTDDTVTTIAVAAALQEGKETHCGYMGPLRRLLKHWCGMYPDAGYGKRFKRWILSDEIRPYGSYGNGAAMRVSPAAWVGESLDEVQELAELTAVVTHDHDEAIKGAVAVASAIYLSRMGKTKDDIRSYMERHFYPMDKTMAELRENYDFTSRTKDSIPQAIASFLESTDFADAIGNAISLGSDADTQAAIAGSIAEAYYGVPEELWTQAATYLTPPLLKAYDEFAAVYLKNTK